MTEQSHDAIAHGDADMATVDRRIVVEALQDEISEAIVNALKLKLLPEEKKAIEQRTRTGPVVCHVQPE